MKRILHVVTNVAHYDNPGHPTGLWLSELTHAWDIFSAEGHEQHLVSPQGGRAPLEPRALKWPLLGTSARAWLNDPARMALLDRTAAPDRIDPHGYDAIHFTGGHGVMWDFPDSAGLQHITREIWDRGGVVGAVCHGYCGLLNTRLSDDTLLVAGRRLTGCGGRRAAGHRTEPRIGEGHGETDRAGVARVMALPRTVPTSGALDVRRAEPAFSVRGFDQRQRSAASGRCRDRIKRRGIRQ